MFARPVRILCGERIADCVVLLDEQLVQEAQAQPPIIKKSGVGIPRGGRCMHRLEVGASLVFQRVGSPGLSAVDLRCIPPMRFGVDEGLGGVLLVLGSSGRIASCPLDSHRRIGPAIVLGVLSGIDLEGWCIGGCPGRAVAEPTVGLELDPSGGQKVDRWGVEGAVGSLGIAGQELATDDTWVRAEQSGVGIGWRFERFEGHVSAKAGIGMALRELCRGSSWWRLACDPHGRVLRIVETPLGGPPEA